MLKSTTLITVGVCSCFLITAQHLVQLTVQIHFHPNGRFSFIQIHFHPNNMKVVLHPKYDVQAIFLVPVVDLV